jgi:hypothetical protein
VEGKPIPIAMRLLGLLDNKSVVLDAATDLLAPTLIGSPIPTGGVRFRSRNTFR